MPQLGESHTEYITAPKHSKTTGIKYKVTELVTKEYLKDGFKIAELFGGVGITTGYILDAIAPSKLFVTDIAEDCVNELIRKYGKIENVIIAQSDSFHDYSAEKLEEFDFIFIDSTFKFSIDDKFEYLLEQLKNLKCKIMFTESEMFKMLFVKQDKRDYEREKHFKKFIEYFKKYNLFVEKIYWCSSNSYLILGREEIKDPEIIEITDIYKTWRKYLDPYKKGRLLG